MHVLYYERFSMTEQLAEEVLPRGEEPLVRLMLKYLLYRRNVICDPLFAEYIATAPEYASRGKEFSKDQIVLYYGDSRDAFACFGERAIVPTFDLTKEQFKAILDRSFELAERARREN